MRFDDRLKFTRLNSDSGRRMLTLMMLSLVGLLLAACVAVNTPKVYRVGFLSGSDTFKDANEGFKAGLTELGYIEGENISYDFQSADGDREKMEQIAEKFVADRVDLIFTTTTGAAQVAQAATAGTDIPVIFTIVSDPVGSGVVADLRQPGGNITGATRSLEGLISKRVIFLHQMAPDVKRLWVPYAQDYPNADFTLKAIRQASSPLEIELIETPVSTVEEVIAEIARRSETGDPGFDAIQIVPDPTIQSEASLAAIFTFASDHNLPVVANAPDQVRQGALLTYSDDNFDTGQLAAPLADKIFQGANPATIPVAFSEPHLYINYKTAQALGLTIDDSLLMQASEIVR